MILYNVGIVVKSIISSVGIFICYCFPELPLAKLKTFLIYVRSSKIHNYPLTAAKLMTHYYLTLRKAFRSSINNSNLVFFIIFAFYIFEYWPIFIGIIVVHLQRQGPASREISHVVVAISIKHVFRRQTIHIVKSNIIQASACDIC